MSDWQDELNWAWVLTILQTPTPLGVATTDLTQPAAVATLGGVYTKRIIKVDEAVLTQQLSELFYGVDLPQNIEFTIDNSDGFFDQSLEWRLVPCTLKYYDRKRNLAFQDWQGLVMQALPQGSVVKLILGSHDTTIWETLLPAAVINPEVGSPFELSGAPGVPLPVIFGDEVPVRPVSASADVVSDPGGYDYILGYGALKLTTLFQDYDPASPGFERMGVFAPAPGSPTLVSATRFSVSDDQRVRYEARSHIRFQTTASGGTFLYSVIKLYDTTTTPDQVEIEDALLGAGLTNVQIAGDYFVIRGAGYDNVTDGLMPVPAAPGADFTAIRLFDPSDAHLTALVSNLSFTSNKHIADAVSDILTDATWGLSAHTTQAVSGVSFAAANTALATAGLIGAVNGALAYDQQQRRAGDVMNELLMMRGMRLLINENGAWTIEVDTQPVSPTKTFYLGTGSISAIRIKRVLAHGRRPATEAIKTVILHWECLGRGLSGNQKFTPREYGRLSKKAVSTLGQEKHYFSQWIRTQAIAEKVTHYLAEKLKGADELLEIAVSLEGRDTTLGETITVLVPSDEIVGEWQVVGKRLTLTDVTLSCIRNNTTAYGAASGVTTTEIADPADNERRTPTGSGSNLLPNPELGPPIGPTVLGVTMPHLWLPGSFTDTYPDYSDAIRTKTIGGHYIRLVTAQSLTPTEFAYIGLHPGMHALGPSGAEYFYCPPGTILMASVYCDQTTGVFFAMRYKKLDATLVHRLIPLMHDPTDVTPNGWARLYGRSRTPIDTIAVSGILSICISKAGTYQFDAAMLEAVPGSARRPSPWRRHKPQDFTLHARQEITFNGASSYTATSLIPAAVKVKSVTARVTQAITLGGGTTGYNVGTSSNATAWGANIANVALDTMTTLSDFTDAGELYYPTATSVIVAGVGGSITSGKLLIEVEYSRPNIPAGA